METLSEAQDGIEREPVTLDKRVDMRLGKLVCEKGRERAHLRRRLFDREQTIAAPAARASRANAIAALNWRECLEGIVQPLCTRVERLRQAPRAQAGGEVALQRAQLLTMHGRV